jgi:hypothetical protein
VTKPGGCVCNITWNRNKETTAFLRKYYPAIGLELVEITPGMAVLKSPKQTYRFERVPIPYLMGLSKQAGLVSVSSSSIGPLWTAVTSVKP